ncbi:MAG: GDSL-type esterase/lipase family protein [Ferruginibacter sp.]
MRSFCTRILLLVAFFAAFAVSSRANDSDIVNCNKNWRIVVLGSSTPFGTGASTYDSSWVGKFTSYVLRRNAANEIVNLAIPGFTTYQNLRPDGYTPPPGRPSPTAGFNITAALALDPDAIIINMPSNDAFNNYTITEQQDNFEATMALADAANVPVWVTTSQPRNNLTLAQTQNLIQLRDWVQTRFGDKAVDFWSTIANPDGTIVSLYGFDNVHVNNAGHNLFFTRVAAETILDSLCNRFTGTLVARAGNDQSIVLPANSVTLDGSLSSSSGVINSYSWSKISGPATFTISSHQIPLQLRLPTW